MVKDISGVEWPWQELHARAGFVRGELPGTYGSEQTMTIGERIRKAIIEFMQRHDPQRAETERIWRNKEAEREWRKERKS